jgi:hypothetical protein
MKMLSSVQRLAFWLAGVVLATAVGQAQTFKVYDQMVLPGGLPPDGGGIGMLIRTNQPFGQSFVPSLSQVGFIELYLSIYGYGGPLGPLTETTSLLLREDSIAGKVLGETDPITITYDGTGRFCTQEFDFHAAVNVLPGQTYVFQVLHVGGDDLVDVIVATTHVSGEDLYPQGRWIWGGRPLGEGADIWFREGVIVPEPSGVVLLLLGMAALAAGRWWLRRGRPFL